MVAFHKHYVCVYISKILISFGSLAVHKIFGMVVSIIFIFSVIVVQSWLVLAFFVVVEQFSIFHVSISTFAV